MNGSMDDTSLLLDSSLLAHLPPEQQEEVTAAAADKKRFMEKIAKLKKKLHKTKEARKKLQRQVQMGAGDERAKREAWEESILKEAAGGKDQEAPLSASGKKIVALQGECRKLQIRTKTIDGMMKPLQKNLNALMEENKELRTKFSEVTERIKVTEAKNQEMLRRRLSADKRSLDLQREKRDRSGITATSSSHGGQSLGLQRALRQILEVLEYNEADQNLIDDIRDRMNEMNVVDTSENSNEDSNSNSLSSFGPARTPNSSSQKSRRRLKQGAMSGMGSPALSASSHSGS